MSHEMSLIKKCEGVVRTTSIEKCMKMMAEKDTDVLFVVDENNKLVGIATEIDFAKIVKVSPSGWTQDIISSEVPKSFIENPISSIMSKEVVCAEADDDFDSVVKKMLSMQTYKRIPVVENGKLVGFIRLVDVVRKMLE
jgi:CBS domain-containing protein